MGHAGGHSVPVSRGRGARWLSLCTHFQKAVRILSIPIHLFIYFILFKSLAVAKVPEELRSWLDSGALVPGLLRRPIPSV